MRRRCAALTVVAASSLSLFACGGGSDAGPTSPSTAGSTAARLATSHNAGRDCLGCHREFTVAGTLFRSDGTPLAGGSVRLTTAAEGAGTAVVTLTSDGSGNFYTRQSVAFGGGLYADTGGTSGARSTMKAAVTSGACNSCHDSSRRITAN